MLRIATNEEFTKQSTCIFTHTNMNYIKIILKYTFTTLIFVYLRDVFSLTKRGDYILISTRSDTPGMIEDKTFDTHKH